MAVSTTTRELAWWKPHLTHWHKRFACCGASGPTVGWTNSAGLHVLYWGSPAVADIDWGTPVGAVSPTAASPASVANYATVTLPASSTLWFGLRAISPGGSEEQGMVNVQRIVTDGDGVPTDPAPNAPHSLTVTPLSGGRFALTWKYDSAGQQLRPATFAIYHDNGTGTVSYAAPIAAVPTMAFVTAAYADGTTVKFVVRARSASGDEETNTNAKSATADATGPADVEAPAITEGSEL